MTASSPITTLFLDIGGVLLANGWDHHNRIRAAEKFDLDYEELNERQSPRILDRSTGGQGAFPLKQIRERAFFQERFIRPSQIENTQRRFLIC
jgi:putative hydrolase of the HAD superfamily